MTELDKIIIDNALVSKENPNALGEILRSWAFSGEGYGCYHNFNVRPEFIEIPPTTRELSLILDYPLGEKEESLCNPYDLEIFKMMSWFLHPNGIEMGYYWDGDGTLCFFIPELEDNFLKGTILNTDCKKDNEWFWGYKS